MNIKSQTLYNCFLALLIQSAMVFATLNTKAQTAFTAGDIVVLMVGDGHTATLTSIAYGEFVQELNTSGSLVQVLSVPSTTAGARSVESGSASSDGDLVTSADGRFITFTGYDAPVNTAGIVAASGYNRIIGMYDNSATASFPASYSSSSTAPKGFYIGSNFRSAVTNDGTGFWTAGSGTNGGIVYIPSGTTSATTSTSGVIQLNTTYTNTRTVEIFNNQLYGNASSTYVNPFTIGSGLPASTSQSFTSLGCSNSTNGYSFVMFDRNRDGTPDLIYIADFTNGLVKYYLNSSNVWTAAGKIAGVLTGITGYLNCSNQPVLFMTQGTTGTTANKIYKYTDVGSSNSATITGGSLTTIRTATSGLTYRGIAMAPTLGDLTVAANTNAAGNYRRIIINSGTLTLTGNVKVSDSVYVASGATLDCGSYILSGQSFVLAAGAKLKIGDPNGITAASSSGNIQTSCRVYNSAATYVYEGAAAQVTGDGLPLTVNNLIINNTSTGVTLSDSVYVSVQLNLTSGVLYSDTTNMVIMGTNSSTINASNSSYVDGPVKKYGNFAFTFPVGSNGYYAPISMSGPSLSTDNFRAQYFNYSADNDGYNVTSIASTIDHVSGCEYWILNRTGGTSSAFVTLSWDSPRSCGVTSLSDLIVAKWDGAVWRDYGQSTYTGNFTAGTVISSSAIPSFSPFTLGSGTPDNPLPIELLTFDANYNGTDVNLNWVTASEKNNDYFSIERSADGVNFNSIAKIKGAGNTSFRINYSDIDKNPLEGISYYRLKQTDFNGNYTYSDIRPITIVKSFSVIKVYPIPTDNAINIELSEKTDMPITIKLTNILGELVYESTQMVDKNISIDVTKLPAAVYFINLSSENYSYKTKVVKQ